MNSDRVGVGQLRALPCDEAGTVLSSAVQSGASHAKESHRIVAAPGQAAPMAHPRQTRYRRGSGNARSAVLLLLLLATLISGAAVAEPKFVLFDPPRALPDIQFIDGDGRDCTLGDFRGKVVLLNVWATWCIPCRKEMPTLDRLQSTLGADGLEVVALSIDRGGLEVVREFYGEAGISRLATYVDASGRAFRELTILGLPTTLLIDRTGREAGRLVGPAEWDAPGTVAFLRRPIGRQTGAFVPPISIRLAGFDDAAGTPQHPQEEISS